MPRQKENIIVYTDGACLGNPGPGGYGVVIIGNNECQELSGGFRLTTNNRMELMAVIMGLKSIRRGSNVQIFSDSYYVVSGVNTGRAKRWQANRWMRNRNEKALNADLWEKLLSLCKKHTVNFKWIRGHNGHVENERCDWLSAQAAHRNHLPPDIWYEKKI